MMALDRTYIHKIFKRKMGMSIKEYIVQIRMTTACSLLRYTNLSISDISRSVGYADVLYFSKSFRQKKGCSPSEYRAQKQPGHLPFKEDSGFFFYSTVNARYG